MVFGRRHAKAARPPSISTDATAVVAVDKTEPVRSSCVESDSGPCRSPLSARSALTKHGIEQSKEQFQYAGGSSGSEEGLEASPAMSTTRSKALSRNRKRSPRSPSRRAARSPSPTRRGGPGSTSKAAEESSTLDRAREQWRHHKECIEGALPTTRPATVSDRDGPLSFPSRSRSKSPERCPMHSGTELNRRDHRHVGAVGSPVAFVDTLHSDARMSKERSKSPRRTKSPRWRTSGEGISTSSREARDDSNGCIRDTASGDISLLDCARQQTNSRNEPGCANILDGCATNAVATAHDAYAVINICTFESPATDDKDKDKNKDKSKTDADGGGRLSLANSFASNKEKVGGAPDLLPPSSISGGILERLGTMCGQGICSTPSAFTGLCLSPPESPDRAYCGDDDQGGICVMGNSNTGVGTGRIMNGCATPGLAAVDAIAGSNELSFLDGEDLIGSDESADARSRGCNGMSIRKPFSFLSPTVPADAHNARTIQRRNRPFTVAILDDRLDSTGSESSSSVFHIQCSEVLRDPGLLDRSHFTGWDGRRSHYTVLTSPTTGDPNDDKDSLGVLNQLHAVPGTLSKTQCTPSKGSIGSTSRWQSQDAQAKLDCVDTVIHLVHSPLETPNEKNCPDEDSEDEENNLLDEVMSLTRSFMTDTLGESLGQDDEDSYAPSTTVGQVEGQVLRNFLGSDVGSIAPETPSAASPPSMIEAASSAKSPLAANAGGRPPLILNRAPALNRLRADTLNTHTTYASRTSEGSLHRRHNSAQFFSQGTLAEIVNLPSPINEYKYDGDQITSPQIKEVNLSMDDQSDVSPMVSPIGVAARTRRVSVKGMKQGRKNREKERGRDRGVKSKPRATRIDSRTKSRFSTFSQSNHQVSVNLFGSNASAGTDGCCVVGQGDGSSSLSRRMKAPPIHRESSLVPASTKATSPSPLEVDASAYLVTCPLFRRALRSMGRRKTGRPTFEAWVAFSKGDRLVQRLKAFHQHGLAREDLRYVVMACGEQPTLHVFTSKIDKQSGQSKIGSVEHLVLSQDMFVETIHVTNKHGHCLTINDRRNGKVISTIVPVLLKPNLFTDQSKACLISERKYEQLGGGMTLSPTVEEIFPSKAKGTIAISSKAHFRAELRSSKASIPLGRKKKKAVWGTPEHWVEYAPDGQIDATMHVLFAFDSQIQQTKRWNGSKR